MTFRWIAEFWQDSRSAFRWRFPGSIWNVCSLPVGILTPRPHQYRGLNCGTRPPFTLYWRRDRVVQGILGRLACGRVIATRVKGTQKSLTWVHFMQMSASCNACPAMRLDNGHSVSSVSPYRLVVEFSFLVLCTSINKVVNPPKQPPERVRGVA